MREYKFYGNLPSVKTLMANLNIDRAKAELIRKVINHGVCEVIDYYEKKDLPNPIPLTAKWAYECYNKPHHFEMILEAINEIIEGHGVECIYKNQEPALEYINMGDSYVPTIVFNRDTWTFRCCSWGDIVEKGRYD